MSRAGLIMTAVQTLSVAGTRPSCGSTAGSIGISRRSAMAGWRSCCAPASCGSTAGAPRRVSGSSPGQIVRIPPLPDDAAPPAAAAEVSRRRRQDAARRGPAHGRRRHRPQQAARPAGAGRHRPDAPSRRHARRAEVRCRGAAAPGAPARQGHQRRAAARPHGARGRQAHRRVPQPRGAQMLLGAGGRRAQAGQGPDRRAAGQAAGRDSASAWRSTRTRASHAITWYRVVASAYKKAAWLELEPRTGRTHQLRAHCALLGTPIQGDALYGGDVDMLSRRRASARSCTCTHAPSSSRIRAPAPCRSRRPCRRIWCRASSCSASIAMPAGPPFAAFDEE